MAKWALVNKNNGGLTDICDEADKFDVYDGSMLNLSGVKFPMMLPTIISCVMV